MGMNGNGDVVFGTSGGAGGVDGYWEVWQRPRRGSGGVKRNTTSTTTTTTTTAARDGRATTAARDGRTDSSTTKPVTEPFNTGGNRVVRKRIPTITGAAAAAAPVKTSRSVQTSVGTTSVLGTSGTIGTAGTTGTTGTTSPLETTTNKHKLNLKTIATQNSQPYNGRWSTITLYQTKTGQYLCERIGHSNKPGEHTKTSTKIYDNLNQIENFFGYTQQAFMLYKKIRNQPTQYINLDNKN